MPSLHAIPRTEQRDEPWANGAGSTTVVLREPDDANWRVRISVAKVEHDGPFSDLPGTQRTLIPLDGPMTLRFAGGRELHANRLDKLQFAGSPAPAGLLPQGPTRDFNLMLRGDAHGDMRSIALAGTFALPGTTGLRWLVYLHDGHAELSAGAGPRLVLAPADAALIMAGDGDGEARLEGNGEIILVKLYP